jgi:hypothetical protein
VIFMENRVAPDVTANHARFEQCKPAADHHPRRGKLARSN